jgi:cardiolipin synthase
MSSNKNKDKSNQILLLKKSKGGIMRIIFGRTGIVILLLLIQILSLFFIFRFLESLIVYTVSTLFIFSIFMVVYVINSQHNTSVKLSWVTLIMLLPGFRGLLYLFIKEDIGHRAIKKRLKTIEEETQNDFVKNKNLMKQLKSENKRLYNLNTYTLRTGGFPVYENTSTKYFPLGEDAFKEILIQLKKAEKFIFMEYFIVDEGYMWGGDFKGFI